MLNVTNIPFLSSAKLSGIINPKKFLNRKKSQKSNVTVKVNSSNHNQEEQTILTTSDSFHLAQCPQGPSMLLQKAGFPSFLMDE